MIQVVVFDLDDTLYLERQYVQSGFHAVDSLLRERGIDGFYRVAWGYFVSGERDMLFNRALDQMEIKFDDVLIQEMLSCYRNHMPEITLEQSTLDVILELKKQGKKLALITDGNAVQQNAKVKALGLSTFFDKIVITDELGSSRRYWKPHVKPYQEVAKYFNLQSNDFVYVGDNDLKDFVSAKKLGWMTIKISLEFGLYREARAASDEFKADFSINSIKELLENVS